MLTIDINRKIELSEGALEQPLGIKFVSGDKQAHRVNAELYRGGKPVDLSGATVLGRFLRADGATVEVQGQVTGNVASVTFDATCYAVPGRLDVSLQLTQSGVITTPLILHAMIRRGATNVIVDPGNIISDLSELLEMIDDMDSAREAAAAATETALEAAGGASQAAGTAIASAEAADTAAAGALAAAQEALDAGARADGSAAKIDGMTVAASTLGAGQNATAVVSEVDGVIHIAFGIPRGDKGDKGDPGQGLDIRGTYATVEALAAAVPSPEQGWMYNVGTEPPYSIYMWDVTLTPPDWRELGQLTAPPTVHVGPEEPTGGETVWVKPGAPSAGTTGADIPVGPEDTRTVAAAIAQHDQTVTVMTSDAWNALDTAARAALYAAGTRIVAATRTSGTNTIISLADNGGARLNTGADIPVSGTDATKIDAALEGKQEAITSANAVSVRTALGLQNGALMIVKWGNFSATVGGNSNLTQQVQFDAEFPNYALTIMATAFTGNPRDISASVTTLTTSGFTAFLGNRLATERAASFYWMAIGR